MVRRTKDQNRAGPPGHPSMMHKTEAKKDRQDERWTAGQTGEGVRAPACLCGVSLVEGTCGWCREYLGHEAV